MLIGIHSRSIELVDMRVLQLHMPLATGACNMAETPATTALVPHGGPSNRLPEQIGRPPAKHWQRCRLGVTPARCRHRPFRCQASGDGQQSSATTSQASSDDRIRQTITGLDLLLGIDEEAERKKKAEVTHPASLTR